MSQRSPNIKMGGAHLTQVPASTENEKIQRMKVANGFCCGHLAADFIRRRNFCISCSIEKCYGLVTVEFLRGIYLPHPHGRACNIKQTVFTRESCVEKFDAIAFASQQQKGSLP